MKPGEAPDGLKPRCEGCGHPMSKGTWEGEELGLSRQAVIARVLRDLRQHGDTDFTDGLGVVHFSPCDEGCRHYDGTHGPRTGERPTATVRPAPEGTDSDVQIGALISEGYGPFEASWRPVSLRTLGGPDDLRPENLAVLCLRCWAAESAAKNQNMPSRPPEYADMPSRDLPWRVGRKLGRTIYVVVNDEPSDQDVCLGMLDTSVLAQHIVDLHNAALASKQDVENERMTLSEHRNAEIEAVALSEGDAR